MSNNIKPINVNGAANSANDAKLPEIMKSIERGEIIFITEGEKCADSLWALGLPATCNAMGAGKWPDKLTPHFKGADVVILPDDDVPGKNHAIFVAEKLRGTAKRVRIIELPGLAPKGDVFDWLEAGGTAEQLHEIIDKNINIDDVIKSPEAFGEPPPDGPLPLFSAPPDGEPYPTDSLGPTLSRAAKAIAAKVQCPDAMAAQSVLAAASLAACSHADVMMPFGQASPLVLYMATVASSGDRKSTADNEALWPIYKREKNLREEFDAAIKVWKIEHAAWAAEKRKIEGAKIDFSERKGLLNSLGEEPPKPLSPFLVTGDLTVEGLTKNWPTCHAAL